MAKPRTTLLLTLTAMAFSAILLLLLLTPPTSRPQPHSHHSRRHLLAVEQHCDGTLYPDLCASTLSTIPDLHKKSLPEIISAAVNHTFREVLNSATNCSALFHRRRRSLDPRQDTALSDCLELLSITSDDLKSAMTDLSNVSSRRGTLPHLQTVLSAAITNQYTCLDGFAYVPGGGVRSSIESRFYHISRLVSNSLAMSKKIHTRRRRHREAIEGYGRVRDGFPAWVSAKDRRLLQAPANSTKVDLVVAKDGSGNFTTVAAAVAAAPNSSATRFVIYIKAGAYFENVEVGKKTINVMFIGDGIGKTVIKASLNVVDNTTTYRSATVAVVGNGFLARDLTVENSAGPAKHQAVALRSGSDLSAFYRCSFVGYQDTLYVHSLRQFYRECDIYGTVDFIFGNAAVVFQNCNLYARKPDVNQKNIFTAQGREDPNQNTGISIQNCKVTAASDLIPVQSSYKSYLGRPWKQYSRTVYLQSLLDGLIDPAGWLEWDGDFALSTLYYGEYKNRGPGSNTTARVKWPGYRVINSSLEANNFTVVPFIQGDQWLGSTMIPFSVGLS